jgi:ubiquinone/menaquinone biosynthesis C-methylase UbiE
MTVNPNAASGFGALSDQYERARPSYPSVAVARLQAVLPIRAGSRVLDLAAGTGKLTRLIAADGVSIVAVEPSPTMRAEFAVQQPGIEILEGAADSIPLETASVDAVVVAQAFHWFATDAALAEIQRVLALGGGFGVIRNERDESVPWVHELTKIMRWHQQSPPLVDADFGAIIDASHRFEPTVHERFPNSQTLTIEGLVERVASTSYFVTMEPVERETVFDQVRDLVRDFPEPFELPYNTDVYWTHRL